MANGTRAGARIAVLPCAAGPGSPTSPFLARWGGDSHAAAPRKPGAPSTRGFRVLGWKPGFGFPGRNAAKRAQNRRQISLTQNKSAARQKDEYQPSQIFHWARSLHCSDSPRSTRSILKSYAVAQYVQPSRQSQSLALLVLAGVKRAQERSRTEAEKRWWSGVERA
jgi:hypothetical protein